MNYNFYKNLETIEDITFLNDNNFYEPLPNDWLIIATDIKNSTKYIEAGKYKDVNMLGALTIIAVLNINKSLELPYIFGGDGSFIFIPKSLEKQASQALIHIKRLALKAYGLSLRVGIFDFKVLESFQKQILISKQIVSDSLSQVVIKGGALEIFDELLKKDDTYLIKESLDENFNLDISGLECRWEDVKTSKDETLTILIKAKEEEFYKEIFSNLDKILGSISSRSAITQENLNLSFNDEVLEREASLYSSNSLKKIFIKQKLKLINLLGKYLMDKKIAKWEFYKKRVVSTTDSEKFDDMIRMVVSTSFEESERLEEYLNTQKCLGKLNYGIHKSDSSLMTCLIFERHGKHMHFVDGSNGGYALAAKKLKEQL